MTSRLNLSTAVLCAAMGALCSPANGTTAYYATYYDAWAIMPGSVHSRLNTAGLEQLYADGDWAEFRSEAQDYLDTASISNETRCYVLYLMANMGDVGATHWRADTAELNNRLQFMDEAESLAVGIDSVRLLEMVRDFRITVNLPADLNRDNLRIALSSIRDYNGLPYSPYAEAYPAALPVLYRWADVPQDSTIAQLETLATTHPVEGVRFLCLVAKGIVYLEYGNTLMAQGVANQMKSTYSTLWEDEPAAVHFEEGTRGLVTLDIKQEYRRQEADGNNCQLCYIWRFCNINMCDQLGYGHWFCTASVGGRCDGYGRRNCGGHACSFDLGGCEGQFYGCTCHTYTCNCR